MNDNHDPTTASDPGPTRREDDLPRPLLPEQPPQAGRPVLLRVAPERTADPSDWDVAGVDAERSRPLREVDELGADAARDLRRESPPWVEHESSYTTELQQGAVHPAVGSDDEGDA